MRPETPHLSSLGNINLKLIVASPASIVSSVTRTSHLTPGMQIAGGCWERKNRNKTHFDSASLSYIYFLQACLEYKGVKSKFFISIIFHLSVEIGRCQYSVPVRVHWNERKSTTVECSPLTLVHLRKTQFHDRSLTPQCGIVRSVYIEQSMYFSISLNIVLCKSYIIWTVWRKYEGFKL